MKVAKLEFSLFGINTYVVYDEKTSECVVVDPGMLEPKEFDVLDDFITEENLSVKFLVNTHLHIDHVIGDSYVQKKYGVGVSANIQDAELGNAISQQAQMFGLGKSVDNVTIENILKEGDVIKLGDESLHVLHIPGHSPGHIVLYSPTGGFIVGGDVLFQGSIGRSDLWGGNHEQLISGINEKLLSLPDDTIVYPGHGPNTTIGWERNHNPFL